MSDKLALSCIADLNESQNNFQLSGLPSNDLRTILGNFTLVIGDDSVDNKVGDGEPLFLALRAERNNLL
jgi:hypothetical protein